MIKRNSQEFKALRDVLNDYEGNSHKRKYIHLFALKPSEDLSARKKIPAANTVVYDLTFEALQFNMLDSKHKLFRDEKTGIYYFKSSANSEYIEIPFQIEKAVLTKAGVK